MAIKVGILLLEKCDRVNAIRTTKATSAQGGRALLERLMKRMLRLAGIGEQQPAKIIFDGGMGWSGGITRIHCCSSCRLSTHTYVYITCIIRVEFNGIKEDRKVDRAESVKREREKKHREVLVV